MDPALAQFTDQPRGEEYPDPPVFLREVPCEIAEVARMPLKTIRTFLKRLEKSGFLTQTLTIRNTLITLPKYDFYQQLDNYRDSANTNSNTRLTTNKNGKNGRMVERALAPLRLRPGGARKRRRLPYWSSWSRSPSTLPKCSTSPRRSS